MIALGIGLAGWWIGEGFRKGRAADRYAAVKGLAERDVVADLALWPVRFVVTNNDLAAAQRKKFAADSGVKVGEVRRASQGIFEILARDETPGVFEPSQLDKKVRVVATLEFELAP